VLSTSFSSQEDTPASRKSLHQISLWNPWRRVQDEVGRNPRFPVRVDYGSLESLSFLNPLGRMLSEAAGRICSLVHTIAHSLRNHGRATIPPEETMPAKPSPRLKSASNTTFNAQGFLDSAGVSRKVVEFRKKETIFSQGDRGETVLYIQKGGVRLSVVNETGKEAVVGVLGPGDFFGEGCLAGQPLRIGTATAVSPSTVLIIEKEEMIRVLHAEHAFSDRFISHMLSRNIRIEEDLVDQLFNSSEKRLARTLLLLARYGKEDKPENVLPKISQEMLAEMVGTTRSRVNFFMNKFKKLGFIKYNGGLQINSSLLSVVLHD
jgi:CRP/FNR family transcriptional regulator, cyclic AMP receptor protein